MVIDSSRAGPFEIAAVRFVAFRYNMREGNDSPKECCMRRWMLCCVVMLALVSAVQAQSPPVKAAKSGKGELRQVEQVPVLSVAGTPQELGEQEAQLVAERAKVLLGFGPALVKRRLGDLAWKANVAASRSLLVNVAERHRQEIAAFQKKSGLSDDDLIAGQMLYDTTNAFGCSSLLVPETLSSTGGPLFGRNFDYASLGLLHANDLVKVVRPEGRYAFAAVTFPGCFGVISGMNEHGLAIALHEVRQAADKSSRFNPKGVPTLLALRQVLEECRTIEEAKELLTKLPRCTMYNLALCDPNGGAVFEVTTKQVAVRKSDGVNACTNHFRAAELCLNKSCERYDALMAKHAGKYTPEQVFARLGQASQGERTFQTMVFEPKAMVMHVSIEKRPSTSGELRRLDLKPLLGK
jgi:isopenicillin-N N-acyltransferase like protein